MCQVSQRCALWRTLTENDVAVIPRQAQRADEALEVQNRVPRCTVSEYPSEYPLTTESPPAAATVGHSLTVKPVINCYSQRRAFLSFLSFPCGSIGIGRQSPLVPHVGSILMM